MWLGAGIFGNPKATSSTRAHDDSHHLEGEHTSATSTFAIGNKLKVQVECVTAGPIIGLFIIIIIIILNFEKGEHTRI